MTTENLWKTVIIGAFGLALFAGIMSKYGNEYDFVKDESSVYRMNRKTGVVERCGTGRHVGNYWEKITMN